MKHIETRVALAVLSVATLMNQGCSSKAVNSNRPRALDSTEVARLVEKGNAYMRQQHYDLAVEYYTRGIAIGPGFAETYGNRGMAYYMKGDYAQSVADYTKFLEMRPGDAEAHASRAYAYFRMKKYEKAWADVRSCQRLRFELDDQFLRSLEAASGGDTADALVASEVTILGTVEVRRDQNGNPQSLTVTDEAGTVYNVPLRSGGGVLMWMEGQRVEVKGTVTEQGNRKILRIRHVKHLGKAQ